MRPALRILAVLAALALVSGAAAVAGRARLAALPRVGQFVAADRAPAWVCPMHPDVRSAHPGRCPICGMDLVEEDPTGTPHADAHAAHGETASPAVPGVSAPVAEAVEARAAVQLDTRRQQLLGARVVEATLRPVSHTVRASGLVRQDETRQVDVTVRVAGWVDTLQADFTGRPVRRGDVLFTLYSPELVAAQQEYLLALDAAHRADASAGVPEASALAGRLVAAARARLALWEVPDADVERLVAGQPVGRTVEVRAPASGVVMEKSAVRGMRVEPGQTLFRLADLSRVWVEADVFETELDVLRPGTRAAVTVDALPGQPFPARLVFVAPTVDPATRAVRARFELANADGRLKPGMFAAVEIVTPSRTVVTVAADAVVDTGRRQVVFLAEGDGRFTPRDVRVGRSAGGYVEVLQGLTSGDRVAASALFFLDSESQLRAALQGYTAEPAAADSGAAAAQVRVTFASEPDPPRAGITTFVVRVADADGRPVTDAEVAVVLFMPAMPSMNMPAMKSDGRLSHAGGGQYRGAVEILMNGRWDATVTVTRGGRVLATRSFSITAG
jgi:Cu(I)/Ag(I) efflux system membrane fusion protein